MHNGIDLKAYYEPVFAIADGLVKEASFGDKEGNYIVILHGGLESIYCHLSTILCKKGQSIKGGECIGISGNSGGSTGPHLHFGIKYMNTIYINPL